MPLGLLEGIRVLDLGPEIAAPFCSRLLADYGADVVKVEPPNVGDPARHMGPFAGHEPHLEKSIPFLYLNTNKRGITLDIGTAAGREVLSDLVGSVDVVVQGFPPSESEALGLDFKTLGESNPGVVVTSITPFGLSGPYRDYSATDIVTCAISGLMYHSGDSDREPLRNGLSQSLYVAGANAAVATVAALFHRMATGQGQQVDVSVVECLATHLVQAAPFYDYMGAVKGRRQVRGSGFEELMPARDGYVVPSIQGSQPWPVVAELIGVEALLEERFGSGAGRLEFGEELKALLVEGLAQWDRKPLFQASGERRLVFGMAQDAGDLFDCPHLRERGFFVEVDHPAAGKVEYPGMGPRLSEGSFDIRYPAPLLGQHNREVYREDLGYGVGLLASLLGAEVI